MRDLREDLRNLIVKCRVDFGIEVTVRRQGDHLTAQLSGQPAAQLHADSQDVFDAGTDGFGISFQREAGKVTNLLLTRAGVNVLAQRLSEHAPHVARVPIALDLKSLADYAGDYRLDANTLARIVVHADKLSLRLTGRTPTPLLAVARDHFVGEDESGELEFQRDGAGKVTGLRIAFAGIERDAMRIR